MKMKKAKRVLLLLMVAVFIVSMAAACDNTGDEVSDGTPTPSATPPSDSTPDTTPDSDPDTPQITPDPTPPPKPRPPRPEWEPYHLGGVELKIGNWWTNNNAAPAAPQNLREEQFEDWLWELEEDWGFTIKNFGVAPWADYLEIFTTSVMAGAPEADIWIMSASWAYQLMAQGLLYPLNTLGAVDVYADKWNSVITDAYTDSDGYVYAISHQKFVEPRNFLFYNKRLFQEAGIDPEEPYDLQLAGEWTWDKFREYCDKLTRDTDGDGIPDTYAFTGFWGRVQSAFINSNNARHIGVNDDGTFYNAMTEPNFIEAMQFVQEFYDAGHWYLGPEDAPWDWFNIGFEQGITAMCIPEGTHISGTWVTSMDDDWGIIYPPKGPRAYDYNTYFQENVYVLPFNIDPARAEEIMFAFDMYTQPLPYDLSNPEYWKDGAWGYQRYRDARVVDETLTMFYEGRMELDSRILIDPGGNWWGETYDWGAVQSTDTSVIEKIEAAAPIINARIDVVNAQAAG